MLDDIDNLTNDLEDLISDSGVKTGGCSNSKRKRSDPRRTLGLLERNIIGDIVGDVVGAVECAVEDLSKIKDAINDDDTSEIQDLVDDLTSINDDIGDDLDDDDDNKSSKDNKSSTDQSSSNSGSCSASAVMRVTSDCLRVTISTGGTSTVTTTCTSSTTVETTGCSLSPTTTTVFASSSSGGAVAECSSGGCGGCNMNGGPLTAVMNLQGGPDACPITSTIASSTAPTPVGGNIGTLTVGPSPPASAASGAAAKRDSILYAPEPQANESMWDWHDFEKRALEGDPANPAAYVGQLNPYWVDQSGATTGQWFPWKDGWNAAGVNGIYGCTAVFVISNQGVFISHIWENPVFQSAPGPANWVSDADFQTNAIDPLLNGDAFTASLAGGAANNGPLSAQFSPQVVVLTPYTSPDEQQLFGITTRYTHQARAQQIQNALTAALPGSTGWLLGYTRTTPEASTAAGGVAGRAILEIDSLQETWVTTPELYALQIGKWRLWIEQYPTLNQEFMFRIDDLGSNTGSKAKRSAAACGGGSPSASASGPAASSKIGSSPSKTGSSPSKSGPAQSSGPATGSTSPGSSTTPPTKTSNVPSSSEAAPFCTPYQDPDQGIKGYCQCSGGADFSFASGSNPCPYTSPGPASLSINPATVTGSGVPTPSNPVPPITIPTTTTTSATPNPSASLAAQCPELKPPVCQTSGGSPLASDCKEFFFQGTGEICAQEYGSGCQNIMSSGTCELTLCQKDDFLGPALCLSDGDPCVEYYINELINTCTSNGRVGGYISIPHDDGYGGQTYLNLEFTYHK